MLARKSLSKKRTIILSSTLAVVWIIIGIVVYKNFVPNAAPTIPTPVLPSNPGTSPAKPVEKFDLQVSTEILRDPALTNLKIYGEIPLQVTGLGRPNPFAPINP